MTPPASRSGKPRSGGRHPQSQRVVVRLTEPAFDDLQALLRLDPQLVRQALKKMLLLERDPEAGEPLHGSLITYRKLVLGNRDRRLIWRVTHEADGTVYVDVAEVWAVGARSDSEVYDEMRTRVAQMPDSPATLTLADVVERLGNAAQGVTPAVESRPESVPEWLIARLVASVGLLPEEAASLTRAEALSVWTAWMSRSE